MGVWVKLVGTNLFGGTETMWVWSVNLHGKDVVEYFNARSEYYCPTVEWTGGGIYEDAK